MPQSGRQSGLFRPSQDLVQPSLNLLAGYAERLYDATNRNDMADYMEMMQAAARAT